MIRHNLRLAFRQLEKYRLQSLVSIVSLAIGFACFAFASMWIRYETTYDAFHKDADRTYYLKERNEVSEQYLTYKIEQFPEVEEATHFANDYVLVNGMRYSVLEYQCDSNFLSFFGTKILEGDDSFLHNPSKVAITDELARKLWGNESPIGQELRNEDPNGDPYQKSRTVTAVIKGWGEHSNFEFSVLGVAPDGYKRRVTYHFFKFSPKANADSVNARLDRTPIPRLDAEGKPFEMLSWQELDLVRLDKVRQTDVRYERNIPVKLNHIYLFAIAGGVLILCGLLNYLTMFINRLFIRKREIALRTVFGALGRDLIVQFITEYALLLFIAMFLGFMVLNASLDWFRTLAELPNNTGYIYREILLYMSMVIAVSIFISLPFIVYFRHQSLQSVVSGAGALNRYNLFRRISTGTQLGIGMCCIFCVVVLMKQLHTLRQGDLGFNRENIGFISVFANTDEVKLATYEFMKQQPEVDTVFFTHSSIYPNGGGRSKLTPATSPQLTESVDYYQYWGNEGFCRFYGLQLLEGCWPNEESDIMAIVVNETFVKLMGWKNPVGESYHRYYSVIGVVKDFKNLSPTTPVQPCMFLSDIYYDQFHKSSRKGYSLPNFLVFRYHPKTWPILKKKLEKLRQDGHLPYADFDSCIGGCILQCRKNPYPKRFRSYSPS